MSKTRIVILDGDTAECSFCGKTKEGVIVETEDGHGFYCWLDLKKQVRMKRNMATNGKERVIA